MNDIYLLPKPILCRFNDGVFVFSNPTPVYNGSDERIKNACRRLCEKYCDGSLQNGEITVTHGEGDGEAYRLTVSGGGVDIHGEGVRGAFWGLQTLTQMLMQTKNLPFAEICDKPRFSYRGFYHDVTRGRIPTLDTLKHLVDELVLYKINSLQIYVEHSFAFKEYAFVNRGQEPLTADEIRELGAYCRERFVDFIPSLSCFGHLYSLLQDTRYSHLCELENYKPAHHLWLERMNHHTLDVSNPDSFSLVTSLIDQYLPLFDSEYFNICCDETFDLCKGRNIGKDSGALYTEFVGKLVDYIESKGKKAMLWGDIVLKHPERMGDIPATAVMLNWNYSKHPSYEQAQKFKKATRRQILCPGTSGWSRLEENILISNDNIRETGAIAVLCDADGILNTNWGDRGHMCDPLCASYGLVLGAAESWNPGALSQSDFNDAVADICFQDSGETVEALTLLGAFNVAEIAFFTAEEGRTLSGNTISDLRAHFERCVDAENILKNTAHTVKNDALLLAARGDRLMCEGLLNPADKTAWTNEWDKWTSEYVKCWKTQNKADELPIVEAFFTHFAEKVETGDFYAEF